MWNTALIFSNKNHGLQKIILYREKFSFFAVDYAKIIELYIVHKKRTPHAIWVDEIADVIISIKR